MIHHQIMIGLSKSALNFLNLQNMNMFARCLSRVNIEFGSGDIGTLTYFNFNCLRQMGTCICI